MPTQRQILVKLAERCNLACPYCYMYSDADTSWKARPRLMLAESERLLVERLGEYLDQHPEDTMVVELHGGEPLLYGKKRMRALLERIRARTPEERTLICLQTNGVLLDEEWCQLFDDMEMSWSISCDGPAAVHDKQRPFVDGRPSHALVERAIRLSLSRPEWRHHFGGCLAVIDPSADGAAQVDYFHDLGIRYLDFLIPDYTHQRPPPWPQAQLLQFLTTAFDRWIALQDPRFHLRIFEQTILTLMGRAPYLDAFGADFSGLVTVETDGTYQHLDVLHICGEAWTRTTGSVHNRSLAEHIADPAQQSPKVCQTCLECPAYAACGGGYTPHRFNGTDFDQPSVHCEAMYGFVAHVLAHLQRVVPASVFVDRANYREPPHLRPPHLGPSAG